METGNDNLINRLTRSVRNNKKGFSILILAAMVVSVIGGVLPSIDGLADNGGPYSKHNVGDGPGVITLTNVSGEQTPSWQAGPNTLKTMSVASTNTDVEEDVKVDLQDSVDTPRRLLAGGLFTVTSLDEVVGEETTNHDIHVRMVTDSNGEFALTGLPVGKYKVKEVGAPTGYEILEKDSLVVEVTKEQPRAHLTFQNRELEVSPRITKEWTEGSEPVNYNMDYEYYGVDGNLVENTDVLFNTDSINIGNVMYFTPKGEVNKVDITKHNVAAKNHKQYDYELIEDVHNVKFLGDQIKRHIVVKKDFDGQKAENVDVELIQLEEDVEIKDSKKVVGKVTLSEKNNWTHTFQDMPRYTKDQLKGNIADRRGEHIEYGVREVDFESEADGYASVVEGNEIDSFVIVNKELEDIDVIIDKVWVGTKGNKSNFEVKVNGEVWETISMTSKDEWTKTVPLKQVPYDAEVTVVEIDADESYDINVIEEDNHKFVVEGIERLGSLEILMNKGVNNPKVSTVNVDRREINTFSMLSAVEEDATDEEATEEDVVEVESTRLAGAKFLVESKEVEEDEEGNSVSVYTKEVTTNKDGLAVIADIPFGEYTITEVESPEGYELGEIKTVDLTVGENQTRNKYRADFYNERATVDAQNLDITVTKEWEFEEDVSGFNVPESVEMKLVSKLPNGEIHEESEVFVLNEANDWTMEFTDMLNVNNKNEYKELDFTVVELNDTDVDYDLHIVKTGSYFNNEGNEVEMLVTNIEALGKINVIKVEGEEGPSTDFELGKNVKAIDGARFELREKESNKLVRESSTTKGGKFTMVNLPYGEYTLTEIEAPEGYLVHETNSIDITVNEPQTRGKVDVKFENEKIDGNVVSVDVVSNWKDSAGKDLDLDLVGVKEIKVELYRNDIKQGTFVTLNAGNGWKASFENLRKFEVGTDKKFEYTVKAVVDNGSALDTGFKTELKGNAKDGYVIENTQIDSKVIDIPVVKKWMNDAKELDKVTLQLKESDKVVKEITLTAKDDWKGTFEAVPVMKNNNQEKVNYTVVELDHEGYKSSVYGNADDSGFEVRNTEKTEEEMMKPLEPAATRNIDVKMNFKGEKPEEVNIELHADGKFEDKVTLTKKNDFKHVFENLKVINKVDDKSPIEYTIAEVKVEGYTIAVKGNMNDGFTITGEAKVIDVEEPKEDEEDPKEEVDDKDKPSDVPVDTPETDDGLGNDDGPTGGIVDENSDIDNTFGGDPQEEEGPVIEDSVDGTPEGEEAAEEAQTAEDGFKQTATSAIGLGLFALAGMAGVGAVAYKKKKED